MFAYDESFNFFGLFNLSKNVDAVTEVLHKFQLSDKIANRVDQLSGGERQRVSLAGPNSDASFWTIDEPLSGLDPKLADTVIQTLCDHAKQKKITFVALCIRSNLL